MAATLLKFSAISYLTIICTIICTTAVSSEGFGQQEGHVTLNKYAAHNEIADKSKQKKDDQVAVQYAPLYSPEIHIRNEMDILPKMNVNENAEVRKKLIEPNLASYPHNSLPYVPGHNIEILQSVNRSPGLPVEYRSISETTEASASENEKKVNYHRAFSVFKKPESILNHVNGHSEMAIPPTNEPFDQYTRIFKLMSNPIRDDKYNPEPLKILLDQQMLRNHQTLQDIHELTKQIESQRIVGYPKMNTMLLNLARVYSPRAPSFNLYLDPASETKRKHAMPRMVLTNPDMNSF